MAASRHEEKAAIKQASQTSANGRGGRSTGNFRLGQSRIIVLAAITLFLVSTVLAYFQSSRPDPFEVVSPLSSTWWWHPREINAFKRLPTITADLNDVFALPGTNLVWVVGNGGTILHSPDAGHTWTKQQIGEPAPLPTPQPPVKSLSLIENFVDPAYAAEPPSPQDNLSPAPAMNLRIVPGSLPEISGTPQGQDIPYQTNKTPLPPSNPSLSIGTTEPAPNKAATSSTDTLTESLTTTRTQQPSNQSSPKHNTPPRKKPVSTTPVQPSALGHQNQTQPSGQSAASTSQRAENPSRAIEDLQTIVFVDSKQGWGAGDNGTLLHTTDGGATWSPQASGTQANLTSLHVLPDGKQGWVAGDNGTLLHTTDGGATWSNAVHYGIGLAPWYFVVGWLCPLGLLWVAHQVQRGEKPLVQEESVADRLISDRPLQLGDPDPLKFGHIAMALSRFIRNEKTDPPLTIAVTGAWGTGKSSLMNLVKGDLEQYGFRPVWFNVWHHQKEEQLLASLLESIRRQAVPPWWQPEHVGFRWRLFTTRFKDHWPLALLIVFVAGLCGGYFLIDPQKRWGHVVEFASNIVKLKLPDDLSQVLSILGLGGTLTPLIALWKGFTTFGLNPAGLLASLSKGASVGDLSVQAGFRERFATEFHEVTQALHPRTMLILIDDLDRCRPEKVLEVLEAINFLVSSGECFVVMGLDLERVERCVGLGFKDVAEELLDDPPPSESQTKETGKQRRTEFARQYMEKLINIEVPVPVMKETESIRLVTDSGMTEIDSYRQWKHPVIPVLKFWRGLLLPITAFAALYLGMWVGMKWFSESPSSLTNIPPPSLSNASQSRSDTNPRVSQAPPPEQRSALLNENSITFSPGETGRPLPWIWVPIASLLLGTGAFLFRTSPGVVVKDSPEFEKALRVWLPLISGKRQTPRSIKRFVNKVRYLAMLQRRREHEPARWEWANNWIGLKPSPNQAQVEAEGASNIPEASLVALSAIQQLCPQWIQSNTLYNISTFIGGDSDQEGATPRRLIRGRIEEHEKQFGAWKNTTDYHEQFLTISGKIRTT